MIRWISQGLMDSTILMKRPVMGRFTMSDEKASNGTISQRLVGWLTVTDQFHKD